MLNRHATSEFMDLVDMTEAVAAGLILDPIYRPEVNLEEDDYHASNFGAPSDTCL